ncbi:NAD(P)H-dependent oxidoreductase [Streptomyces sp. NPDC013178]|uniref:NADPH-dependent FMN reductase n=1 Tax=Streptomyces sp. NPDC013178 TaxID=3155118 RepID=UPI00340CF053
MIKIGIILGSTRPGRNGEAVAKWVFENAQGRDGVVYELVDLADYPLPHLDEAVPAGRGKYELEHTRRWAAKVAEFDGYVFVTPEYNHSISGVLKNAIDFVYGEWNNKAAAIVSYGGVGGARAAEHLRLILGELRVADVRSQVALSLLTEFENFKTFKPGAFHLELLATMLAEVESWSRAMKTIREPAA